MSIRIAVGVLYLLTGLVGIYWAIQLTLVGMYGVPFSWWYATIFVGSLVLVVGAILNWASGRAWAEWVPLVGSAVLATYFVPAILVAFRRYAQGQAPGGELVTRVLMVALVLLSLAVAASNKLHLRVR